MTRIRALPHGRNNLLLVLLRDSKRITFLWSLLCAVILLVRTTSLDFSILGKQFRRWNTRRSRRWIRQLRVEMDRIIKQRNHQIDICFVSSIFAGDLELADKPSDVSSVWLDTDYSTRNIDTTFRFFLFTNLIDLPVSEGWIKIVKTNADLPYRRFITQSRWPKFMGWKDPQLKGCRTVFYFDGHYQLNPDRMHEFPLVAHQLEQSESGLAQIPHPGRRSPLEEFSKILFKHKDIPANVEASILWLQSQPDFDNRCAMYQNSYFGYDPHNPTWQEAVEFFWDRYSLEIDSWRDQPLWCYTLQHIGLKDPLVLEDEVNGLFQKDKRRTGHNNHRYDENADGKRRS
jgi:hypothetical protein